MAWEAYFKQHVYTMPELVQHVMDGCELGLSLAAALESTCRNYDVDPEKRIELRHQVMEFVRMVREKLRYESTRPNGQGVTQHVPSVQAPRFPHLVRDEESKEH